LDELEDILNTYKTATKDFDVWLDEIKKFAARSLLG